MLVVARDGGLADVSLAESVRLCTSAGRLVTWPTETGLRRRTLPLGVIIAWRECIARTADLTELRLFAGKD